MRGKFIVFEGIDGAGTTTQIASLSRYLKEKGYRVHATAEPSKGPIGSMIRHMLNGRIVTSQNRFPDPKTVALLYAADRIDHLENEVTPYLEDGYIVLSDRYIISSFVYQGIFTHDQQWVTEINRYAYQPDLTLFFDISGDVAFDRLVKNRTFLDQYEKREALISLSKRYQEIINRREEIETIITVDATLQQDCVTQLVQERVEKYLNKL